MTPVGKRLVILVINLALGGNEPKTTIKWLVEKNIINGTKSDKRRVQQIVHHWKISSGEIFEKHTSNNEGKISAQQISSVHEEKKPFSSVHEGKKPFECNECNANFEKKAQLNKHSAANFFPVNKKTLKTKIDKFAIEFPTSPYGDLCHFCKNENEEKTIFKCESCNKEFSRKAKLRDHIASVHDENKPFKCDMCPSFYGKKSFLTLPSEFSS